MWCNQGKMQARSRIQFEQVAPLLKFLFVNEISNFPEKPLLDVGFRYDFALVRIKDADLFSATNLKKEIVLRIQMERRYRIGRCEKYKAFTLAHTGNHSFGKFLYLVQALVK
jgi:hypothetical protein